MARWWVGVILAAVCLSAQASWPEDSTPLVEKFVHSPDGRLWQRVLSGHAMAPDLERYALMSLHSRAGVWWSSRDPRQSVTLCRSAAQYVPSAAAPRLCMAIALRRLRQPVQALRQSYLALVLEPRCAACHLETAMCLEAVRDIGELPVEQDLAKEHLGAECILQGRSRTDCEHSDDQIPGLLRCPSEWPNVLSGGPHDKRIFVAFHSEEGRRLAISGGMFRGIAISGRSPAGCGQLDARVIAPIYANHVYQTLVAEMAAMMSLQILRALTRGQPGGWLGLATPGVERRTPGRLRQVEAVLARQKLDPDAVYFWSSGAADDRVWNDMWWAYDHYHPNGTSTVAELMERIFGERTVPHVPGGAGSRTRWMPAQCFLMHHALFESAVGFFAVVLSAFEDTYGMPPPGCPYLYTGEVRCPSYLVERMLTVWAYHTGTRMVFISPEGRLEESFAPSHRRSHLFSPIGQFFRPTHE